MLQKSDIRNGKWSEIQKECYERNCICRGCSYSQYSTRCMVKATIMEKIRLFGLENEVETKKWF